MAGALFLFLFIIKSRSMVLMAYGTRITVSVLQWSDTWVYVRNAPMSMFPAVIIVRFRSIWMRGGDDGASFFPVPCTGRNW